MIKPAYSVSFLLSINIFVWQNVLYFLNAPRINSITTDTYLIPVSNFLVRVVSTGEFVSVRLFHLLPPTYHLCFLANYTALYEHKKSACVRLSVPGETVLMRPFSAHGTTDSAGCWLHNRYCRKLTYCSVRRAHI